MKMKLNLMQFFQKKSKKLPFVPNCESHMNFLKKIRPFDYLVILIVIACFVVGVMTHFNKRTTSSNQIEATTDIELEIYLRGVFCLLFKLLDYVTLASYVDIMSLKAVFDINAERALGEIAQMTLRRHYLIA